MDRLAFLKRLIVPVAAAGAAKFDPDGEPIPESAAQVIVNAPGVTLQNMTVVSGAPRRTAIEITKNASPLIVRDSIVTSGDTRFPQGGAA